MSEYVLILIVLIFPTTIVEGAENGFVLRSSYTLKPLARKGGKGMRVECKIDERTFIPCEALHRCLQESPRAKGIILNYYVNSGLRPYISIRSGKYAETGIIMNFCPFCGTRLDWGFKRTFME